MKLSDRALVLLKIVDDATECDWTTGELSRFYVPQAHAYHLRFRGKNMTTYVSGSGDASALKGLEAKRLIERPRTTLSGKYIYRITENGRCVMEDNWELFAGPTRAEIEAENEVLGDRD